jgi:hypothetical protein
MMNSDIRISKRSGHRADNLRRFLQGAPRHGNRRTAYDAYCVFSALCEMVLFALQRGSPCTSGKKKEKKKKKKNPINKKKKELKKKKKKNNEHVLPRSA